MRGGKCYLDADQFENVLMAVLEEACKLEKLFRKAAWVARWRNWRNLGARDLTSVRPVDMPYARAFEKWDYQARTADLLSLNANGRCKVTF